MGEVTIPALSLLPLSYELFSLESLFPDPEEEHTLLAYKASADPEKMYMHKAMKEPDTGDSKRQ